MFQGALQHIELVTEGEVLQFHSCAERKADRKTEITVGKMHIETSCREVGNLHHLKHFGISGRHSCVNDGQPVPDPYFFGASNRTVSQQRQE